MIKEILRIWAGILLALLASAAAGATGWWWGGGMLWSAYALVLLVTLPFLVPLWVWFENLEAQLRPQTEGSQQPVEPLETTPRHQGSQTGEAQDTRAATKCETSPDRAQGQAGAVFKIIGGQNTFDVPHFVLIKGTDRAHWHLVAQLATKESHLGEIAECAGHLTELRDMLRAAGRAELSTMASALERDVRGRQGHEGQLDDLAPQFAELLSRLGRL